MLRVELLGVADHAEQALVLQHAVNRELGVEYLVAAVLAVGLREHHQFHIGGVALKAGESLHQVVQFVIGQRQTKSGIGLRQRLASAAQHINGL